MASVTLTSIAKSYAPGTFAVRDVSLEVRDGEFLVLVGPSGCGKSTALRMIAGLESISSGTISIGSRVVNDVAPKDRDIAMVFQNYALYPHMTVAENMSFALKMRKLPKDQIQSKVLAAARSLGIEELLQRKPGQLSGGQRQRVAVGRAIVREPQVFLFDEPLSNLDAKLRVTTRAELKALHQRLRTTTIYVTHDQEEAMTLGDRLVVMRGGRVLQVGTPMEVYNAPADRFVAGFVGTPPMNFLDGMLVATPASTGGVGFQGPAGSKVLLEFPAARAAALREKVQSPCVLGVRPTMLSLASGAPHASGQGASGPGLDVLPATVRTIEPLGEQCDVHLSIAGVSAPLVARLAYPCNLTPGAATDLRVDMGRAHAFEPGEAGVRILA
jgi:multiple sugar transport system ATP-binding protein